MYVVEDKCIYYQGKEGVKRKLKSSCSQRMAVKLRKAETRQPKVTDTIDTPAVEDKPTQMENDEEEQVADYINFDDEKIKEALKHLNSFLEEENLDRLKKVLQRSRDGGELEIGLGIHLFSKLIGNAYTSRKKSLLSCPCGCLERLAGHENMWIGSENTWYGELDVIAGNPATGDAVSVYVKNSAGDDDTEIQKNNEVSFEGEETEEEEDTELEGDSPGDQTDVELKLSGLTQALNQIIAQAVVFAFTEYNRHTSKGEFIPSVIIDEACFQYVIYSPADDILLVSNRMVYIDMENFDKKTGFRPFVVLWIILNYRLFFTKCPDFRRHFIKSGFHEKIGDLQQFQNLKDYSKIICIRQNLHFPNDTPNAIGTAAMDWFLDK
ncbi:uncharacterized protein LOC123529510 isoform X2 [Mercenaria mercenaria]|uniref:uncharacterized protein LOC123529510 isoform X2 n=1 Tax=Mercenaria mercenaria TaxID=6596 RepID=UPI001E1DEB7D|nr:uncharacterized protein LOC123529510 isoform X2 [Mercenaria mercenaria]